MGSYVESETYMYGYKIPKDLYEVPERLELLQRLGRVADGMIPHMCDPAYEDESGRQVHVTSTTQPRADDPDGENLRYGSEPWLFWAAVYYYGTGWSHGTDAVYALGCFNVFDPGPTFDVDEDYGVGVGRDEVDLEGVQEVRDIRRLVWAFARELAGTPYGGDAATAELAQDAMDGTYYWVPEGYDGDTVPAFLNPDYNPGRHHTPTLGTRAVDITDPETRSDVIGG